MVFTFYSYKGGVGRTMALANIASLLYKRGLRVLLIDFDLEAPSLEEYFKVVKNKKEEQFGFIDMLVDYKKNISQEHTDTDTKTNPSITLPLQGIDKYIFKVPNDIQKDGSLLLLTSGKKDDNYVKNVHSFDWEDLGRLIEDIRLHNKNI
jgi:cellulose biosynthesis protein BcsQ